MQVRLELATPIFGPPLNDHLLLSEELHRVAPLAMEHTEEAISHPLNGKNAIGAATPMLIPMLPASASIGTCVRPRRCL